MFLHWENPRDRMLKSESMSSIHLQQCPSSNAVGAQVHSPAAPQPDVNIDEALKLLKNEERKRKKEDDGEDDEQ